MAFKLLLLISLAIALASPAERPQGKRLVKLKMGEPAKWMTPEEMKQVLSDIGDKAFGYLDLTREGEDNTENSAKLSKETYPVEALQKRGIWQLIWSLRKFNFEYSVERLSSYHNRHPRPGFGPSYAEGWLNYEIENILSDYKGSYSIRHISDHRFDSGEEAYKQNNILVKLEGQDSDLKSELVILGAHYDTVIGNEGGPANESARAPGADDNGSGCTILLEVLRTLIDSESLKLKRTVEFHFYAATEEGVLGSMDVVRSYEKEKAVVKGMLNLDRCGNGWRIGYVGSDETSEKLTDFVKMIAGEYIERELETMPCLLNCFSDHISWTRRGYPSAYLVEYDQSPHYHSENDTIETLNFELINEFATVAIAFVVELANSGSGRPEAGWTLVGLNLLFWSWSRF